LIVQCKRVSAADKSLTPLVDGRTMVAAFFRRPPVGGIAVERGVFEV
jgi:hypothetical protein